MRQSRCAVLQLRRHSGAMRWTMTNRRPSTSGKMLDEKVSMMTGNSGVGKSTLLNAMEPELSSRWEISEKLGRGRHTTRQVQLYSCAGGCLADTPGFSTFEAEQYVQNEKEQIADCFPGSAVSGKCQFSDCSHVCEKLRHSGSCAGWENRQSRHASYCDPLYQTAKQKGMGVVKRAVIFGGAPVSMADCRQASRRMPSALWPMPDCVQRSGWGFSRILWWGTLTPSAASPQETLSPIRRKRTIRTCCWLHGMPWRRVSELVFLWRTGRAAGSHHCPNLQMLRLLADADTTGILIDAGHRVTLQRGGMWNSRQVYRKPQTGNGICPCLP